MKKKTINFFLSAIVRKFVEKKKKKLFSTDIRSGIIVLFGKDCLSSRSLNSSNARGLVLAGRGQVSRNRSDRDDGTTRVRLSATYRTQTRPCRAETGAILLMRAFVSPRV